MSARSFIFTLLYRAREDAVSTPAAQVVQYEPAHSDAVNCVTPLTSDLCVSGGSDQVSKLYVCVG